MTLMPIELSDPIAPGLAAIGLLSLFLPWVSRENARARVALVGFTLIVTWRYLFWRLTETVPEIGLSADWFCGIALVSAEILTGIGGTITLIMLSRRSSRSETVTANTPWLTQKKPLVDVLICSYNEDGAILERTIIGAMAMEYSNFRVWVLDDGRRAWLKKLCAKKAAITWHVPTILMPRPAI